MDDIFNTLLSKKDEQDVNKENRTKEFEKIKIEIQRRLPDYIQIENVFGVNDEKTINEIKKSMRKIANSGNTFLRTYELEKMYDELILEITGLGKHLTPLMKDNSISEVMINSHEEIYVERNGIKEITTIKFDDERELQELAERIARNVGRNINAENPFVDARLPDGSRVHIIIPPLSRKGITITIRKHSSEPLKIEDLINKGTLSEEMAEFLRIITKAKLSFIVSGGTGSGKTTTLNVLSNFIPDEDRIITIEDSAELQLSHPHVVSLETKNKNSEGKGEVNIEQLVKQTLRMYPTRIIIGETRDGTAYDLINSMSTGHEGSASTIHANNPKNCVSRLTNLVLQKKMGLSPEDARILIGESVDLIVQISKQIDGSRKITNISQVFNDENNEIKIQPIYEFKFRRKNEDGTIEGEFIKNETEFCDKIKEKFTFAAIDY